MSIFCGMFFNPLVAGATPGPMETQFPSAKKAASEATMILEVRITDYSISQEKFLPGEYKSVKRVNWEVLKVLKKQDGVVTIPQAVEYSAYEVCGLLVGYKKEFLGCGEYLSTIGEKRLIYFGYGDHVNLVLPSKGFFWYWYYAGSARYVEYLIILGVISLVGAGSFVLFRRHFQNKNKVSHQIANNQNIHVQGKKDDINN